MVDKIQRGVNAILSVTRGIAAVLLVLSVAVNFANIIGRYFFSVSISWAEESMLFLMVGVVFFGCGSVSWTNRHIRMDVLVNMLPDQVRKLFELLSDLVFIATAATITIFAWPVIMDLYAFDERSQAANFPLVIPQALIPIGLSFMAALVALRIVLRNRLAAATRPAPLVAPQAPGE
jgi:TRAP-type C4-dicarboxylate transport system permease small subunit